MSSNEPQTDREWIMQVDSKVDEQTSAIERLTAAIVNLETISFKRLDERVTILENKEAERSGAYKFIILIITLLGAAVTFLTLKRFEK
jgi:hypothetical protein